MTSRQQKPTADDMTKFWSVFEAKQQRKRRQIQEENRGKAKA